MCVYKAQTAEAAAGISCGDEIAFNYGKALVGMPKVKAPPRSGILPFAARQIYFNPPTEDEIQTGHGRIGFSFRAKHVPARGFDVHWSIRTTVVEVDAKGRLKRRLQRQHRVLNVIRSNRQLDFSAPLARPPGFYRYGIDFYTTDGDRLGGYGQYVRVVRPTLKVGLQLDASSFSPYDHAKMRVVNYGTESISYGEGATFERYDGIQWVPVNDFSSSPVLRRVVGIGAGLFGRCEDFDIPADAVQGSYRVKKEVHSLFLRPNHVVTARFEVGS